MRRPMTAVALSIVIAGTAAGNALSDGIYEPSEPVPLASTPYDWTGFYVGITGGYANGDHSSDDVAGAFLGYPDLSSGQSHGFAGGGTLGVNWQSGSLVYGLETDISWLSNQTSFVDPNGALNNFYPSATNQLDFLGTVRGRLGLAVDNTLIYGTAGFAYGHVENTARYNSLSFPTSNTPSYDLKSTLPGWVVGGGLEHAWGGNWTLKGEALYAELTPNEGTWVSTAPGSVTFPAGAVYEDRFNTSVGMVRGGLNYKFY